MKRLPIIFIMLSFMLMATPLMVRPVQAGESCHKINAKGVGQQISPDITVASITGGGLLNGATFGEFTTTDPAPPVLGFEGTVTFITKHGILAVAVKGTINTDNGDFSASGPVIEDSGTKKLEGATGEIEFEGVQNLADGSFVETLGGEICLP